MLVPNWLSSMSNEKKKIPNQISNLLPILAKTHPGQIVHGWAICRMVRTAHSDRPGCQVASPAVQSAELFWYKGTGLVCTCTWVIIKVKLSVFYNSMKHLQKSRSCRMLFATFYSSEQISHN